MPSRILIGVVAVLVLAFGSARPTVAQRTGYKLIVHPDNPISSVSRDFARNAFLKKSTEWRGGETIRPIDLATKFSVRDRFTQEVIKKTPAQLKSYWNQRIFSGKGVPPPEVESTTDMISYVLGEPGAIGYLPADANPGEAKVIGVD